MQLMRAAPFALALVLSATAARAQEPTQQVDAHGFYYKETSTRVVQPRMQIQALVPATGTDVGAEYALDAITSASIAQGVTRSDSALTEYRNEIGVHIGQSLDRLQLPWLKVPARVGASWSRSRESDYDSDTIGLSASVDLFERNTTWALSYAHTFDTAYNRTQQLRVGSLDTDFVSLSVTQLLSPTALAAAGIEWAFQDGFNQNPYRSAAVGGSPQAERLPFVRNRYTLFARAAQFFPESATTVQLYYRLYHDDWLLDAHTVEGRIYQEVSPALDLRLAYRYYTQDHAYFAKRLYDPAVDHVFTSDPKLFGFESHYIEVQARALLQPLAGVPFLRWFQDGSVDLTLGFLFSSSTYGNCGPQKPPSSGCVDNVISLGLTLPI